MSDSVVRSYFETKLKTFADAQSPIIPISFEGVPFTPTDVPYLEIFIIPAKTSNPTVDGKRKRLKGIVQINVWIKDGKGTRQGTTISQQIIDLFPIVPKGAVSVEETPSIHKTITDISGWRITPVDMPYRYES